jgi:hypothetical protein
MGKNAQYLMMYCERLGIKPRYGIDRMAQNIAFYQTYNLTDELPYVELIVITPYGIKDEEKERIRQRILIKIPDVRFVTMEDLFEDILKGDFYD